MKNTKTLENLQKVLADSYAFYVKLQNYHWHVHGPDFKPLHEFFQEIYTDVNTAIDEIAERILAIGGQAPATFGEFQELTTIKDGDKNLSAKDMVKDLHVSQDELISSLKSLQSIAADEGDVATEDLAIQRIFTHEKFQWMAASYLK